MLWGRSDGLRFSNVDLLEGNSLLTFHHCCQHGQNVHVTKHNTVLQGYAVTPHRLAVGKKEGRIGSCLRGKFQSRGGRIEYIDQMWFFLQFKNFLIPIYLLWSLGSQFPSPRTPREQRGLDTVGWHRIWKLGDLVLPPPFLTAWPWGKPLKHFMAISSIRTLPVYLCAWMNVS